MAIRTGKARWLMWLPVMILLGLAGPLSGQSLATQPTPFKDEEDLATRLRRPGINPDIRVLFVEIEKIARLPTEQQAAGVERLYTRLTPSLMNEYVEHVGRPSKLLVKEGPPLLARENVNAKYAEELDAAAATMSPEAVADAIATVHNSAVLRVAARRRAMIIYDNNLPALKILLDADVASPDPGLVRRAIDVIRPMRLSEYSPRLLEMYFSDHPSADLAGFMVAALEPGPAETTRLLDDLQAHPGAIKRHWLILSFSLTAQPVPGMLAKLLESPDMETRYFALSAMHGCTDETLQPLVRRLVADSNPRIQLRAAHMIFNWARENDPRAARVLEPLLSRQADPRVRVEIMLMYTGRRDRVAIPALIDMLQMPTPPVPLPQLPLERFHEIALSDIESTEADLKAVQTRIHDAAYDMLGRSSKEPIGRLPWAPNSPQTQALIHDLKLLPIPRP